MLMFSWDRPGFGDPGAGSFHSVQRNPCVYPLPYNLIQFDFVVDMLKCGKKPAILGGMIAHYGI